MTPAGVVTYIELFQENIFKPGPGNGAYPEASLTKAANGNIYGTCTDGGSAGGGNIFRLFTELDVYRIGSQVVLSWSTNVAGFTLQSSTNLASPTAWIDMTVVPVVVGGRFTVTNSISGVNMLYRLKK
jgi:hypothetical protein